MSRSRVRNEHDKMQDRIHHGNFESNLAFLRAVNLPLKEQKILEIGSGNGAMLHHLVSEGYDVEGVEIDQDCLDKAQQIYGDLPLRRVYGVELPYESGTFDVVLSFDVLEHIPDTDAHLKEVSRVLKRTGSYLLQSPNKWTNSIFETIRWRSFTKWRVHHCSLHSYFGFRRLFDRHGFETTFYDVPVVTDYFKKKIRAYLGRPGLFMLTIANPDRMPMPLRTNFYIKAHKRHVGCQIRPQKYLPGRPIAYSRIR